VVSGITGLQAYEGEYIADIVEDFIQVLKYIVYIFNGSVHNLKAIVMVHLFNGSVLILMTRGQTGFEGYSVCYAFEKKPHSF